MSRVVDPDGVTIVTMDAPAPCGGHFTDNVVYTDMLSED